MQQIFTEHLSATRESHGQRSLAGYKECRQRVRHNTSDLAYSTHAARMCYYAMPDIILDTELQLRINSSAKNFHIVFFHLLDSFLKMESELMSD